ncbi:tripartite tricarboxylate transporter TctB family protein [Propionimicrobium sp. PCR01-08-3]|uniref:tripartite tricarboxylate transporter TctB family protein n=1 Tax=Propionimicrobium sp. PCR01-08-3 TaxID=3052086 RepID=UPI00255C8E2C|nr:tripartite tricarboxylate transporter TctB family protein [Propionimicrobium sp. PCR01-08-3]WIY81885.1 tripartite tricarboxylate transporter TctB family protein [Propionimicrobium sp. PCR01-08-3]
MSATQRRSFMNQATLVPALILLVLLGWIVLSTQLSLWTDQGQPGPGFWPLVLSALGAVLAAVITVRAYAQGRRGDSSAGQNAADPDDLISVSEDDGESGVYEETGRGAWLRPLGILAGLVAFIALMPVLGFMIGLTLFLLFVCLVLIKMPLVQSLLLTAVLMAITYFTFAVFFGVPFPTGLLGV